MNDLVKIKNSALVISTFDLFKRMGYLEHRMLKKVISSQLCAFNDLGFLQLEMQKPTGKKGGRPTEGYLLNEDQFILLVLLAKNTPESISLKIRVSKEFKRLKDTVAKLITERSDGSWASTRKDGKQVYQQKTDTIKKFVDYATNQGSKSASMYYSNLARMENSALFFFEQKYKNLREVLTIKQLMQVATADDVIEKALIEGMESGISYKDCYKLAKSRVVLFVEIIGKSQIIALEDSTQNKLNQETKS